LAPENQKEDPEKNQKEDPEKNEKKDPRAGGLATYHKVLDGEEGMNAYNLVTGW
jgi:hypothetical protein